jgi:hypothetical protein
VLRKCGESCIADEHYSEPSIGDEMRKVLFFPEPCRSLGCRSRVKTSRVQWKRWQHLCRFNQSKLWDLLGPVDALLRSSPNLRRVDFDVLAVRTHSLALLVSPERFPHVESVGTVGVVVYYSSVDGVPEHSMVSKKISRQKKRLSKSIQQTHPIFL